MVNRKANPFNSNATATIAPNGNAANVASFRSPVYAARRGLEVDTRLLGVALLGSIESARRGAYQPSGPGSDVCCRPRPLRLSHPLSNAPEAKFTRLRPSLTYS